MTLTDERTKQNDIHESNKQKKIIITGKVIK